MYHVCVFRNDVIYDILLYMFLVFPLVLTNNKMLNACGEKAYDSTDITPSFLLFLLDPFLEFSG